MWTSSGLSLLLHFHEDLEAGFSESHRVLKLRAEQAAWRPGGAPGSGYRVASCATAAPLHAATRASARVLDARTRLAAARCSRLLRLAGGPAALTSGPPPALRAVRAPRGSPRSLTIALCGVLFQLLGCSGLLLVLWNLKLPLCLLRFGQRREALLELVA